MPEPYKARVDVRRFLNFPGFHDGAYIVAYVEDTRPRRIDAARSRRSFPSDPVPRARTILEIADCGERINLEFSLYSESDSELALQGRLAPARADRVSRRAVRGAVVCARTCGRLAARSHAAWRPGRHPGVASSGGAGRVVPEAPRRKV